MPKPAYLLDTNILSDLVRRPAGRIRDRIAEHGEGTVCTSIILAAELRFGSASQEGLSSTDCPIGDRAELPRHPAVRARRPMLRRHQKRT